MDKKGIEIVNNFNFEIKKISSITKEIIDSPRVFCMEWINPFYSAGHWVPEMVEIAGGISGITRPSKPSTIIEFNKIVEYAPNYIFIMPCGYTIDDSLNEIDVLLKNTELNKIPAFKKGDVYLVDANSYFTRPTTRIIEGIKLLARTINRETLDYEPPPDSILNLQNYIHFESFVG
jgi:iron complex transport system substrate-binding protein